MGIDLLLRLLKDSLPAAHLSAFRGRRAVVDGLSWVYKACYPAALELLEDTPTREHLDVLFSYLAMLQHYRVEPILVFDGRVLDFKRSTLRARESTRAKNILLARQHAERGERITARKYAQRGIRVTRRVLDSILAALRENGVQFLVAPYEADAQMAWLVQQGHAHFAISEDSDLVAYHVPRVLFKLTLRGRGQYFDLQQMLAQPHADNKHAAMLFALPEKERVYCCILGGCDYFQSLRGVGLKTVINRMIRKPCLETLVLDMQDGEDAPPDLEGLVEGAYHIFQHHWVYDTASNKAVPLHPLEAGREPPASLGSIDWYGPAVAEGRVDPFTLEPLDLLPFKGYRPPAFRSLLEELRHEEECWRAALVPQPEPAPDPHMTSPMKRYSVREEVVQDLIDFEKCLEHLERQRENG